MDVARKTPHSTPSPASNSKTPGEDSAAPAPSTSTSKNDEELERPRRTPTPDRVKCAICLGELVNKSNSNSCFHQFCFGCLLEWSKVKPECPLCKSSFRTIYHNIRSMSDYDEYVVPAPVPHLSIRVTADRSPELLITSGGNHHDYSLPSYFHRAEALMRDRIRRDGSDPSRVFRLQYQFSPYMTPDVNVLLRGGMPMYPMHQENPFMASEAPEFFGAALDLAAGTSSTFSGPGRGGYQGRRRKYDRNQWVRPFDSTLAPGTVFFPSVEYIQRHPSSFPRISAWLHREITVLMSLNSTRSQMAYVYDVIISMLQRHDIRSPEFREGLRAHLGSKTRHFQHEFYYFLLSGMRIEEYDRIAQYTPASSSTATSSTTSQNQNPIDVEPTVVTIDSDDDSSQVEVVDLLDDDDNLDTGRRESSRRGRSSRNSTNTRSNANAPHSSRSDLSDGHPLFPIDLPDSMDAFESGFDLDPEVLMNDIENLEGILRNELQERTSRESNRERGSNIDPEMPVLEPQIDLNNLSGGGNGGLSAFRRLGRHPSASDEPPSLSRVPENGRSTSNSGFFDNLREIYLNTRYDDSEDSRQSSSSRAHRDPFDGRRSPYPSPVSPVFQQDAQPITRSLRSPDFPILQLRQNRERRLREEQANETSDGLLRGDRPSRHDRSACAFQQEYSDYENRIANIGSSERERSSCIHAPSSSSVQIRIFPPAMDLSTQGRSRTNANANSFDARSNSVIQKRPRTPHRPPSPPRSVNSAQGEEECEFLGVHPIVKKPPLAVITLSSEDEDDDQDSQRNYKRLRPSSSPQPGPSYQQFLPPNKRHRGHSYRETQTRQASQAQAPTSPLHLDLDTALSSLPSENLIERHIGELSSALNRYSSAGYGHFDVTQDVLESRPTCPSPTTTASRHRSQSPSRPMTIRKSSASGSKTRKDKEKESKSKRNKKEVSQNQSQSQAVAPSSSHSMTATKKKPETETSTRSKQKQYQHPQPPFVIRSRSSSSDTEATIVDDYSETGDKDRDLPVKKHIKNDKKKKSKKAKKTKSPSKHKKEKSVSSPRDSKDKRKKTTLSTTGLFYPPDSINNSPSLDLDVTSSSIASASASSSRACNASASASTSSSSRLRSVVVKVDKDSKDKDVVKPPKKRKPSRPLLSSSSDSDEGFENEKTDTKNKNLLEPFTTPRLRSVIALPQANSVSVPSSSHSHSNSQTHSLPRSNDNDLPTPSALDLSAYSTLSPYLMNSASASVSLTKSSRRWESDDDDNQNIGNEASESESLLSLEYGKKPMDFDAGSRSSGVSGGGNGNGNDSDSEGSYDFLGPKSRRRLNLDDY